MSFCGRLRNPCRSVQRPSESGLPQETPNVRSVSATVSFRENKDPQPPTCRLWALAGLEPGSPGEGLKPCAPILCLTLTSTPLAGLSAKKPHQIKPEKQDPQAPRGSTSLDQPSHPTSGTGRPVATERKPPKTLPVPSCPDGRWGTLDSFGCGCQNRFGSHFL